MVDDCEMIFDARRGRSSKPLATIRFSDTFPLRFLRVGSSMVEQRPFKALAVGSSPTQPIDSQRLTKSDKLPRSEIQQYFPWAEVQQPANVIDQTYFELGWSGFKVPLRSNL